ncbi:MAG: DNA polymerase I [Fimbriimonadaceae bacterium]|nr:DNA polymerase I [Fimbriimonadaceae bacterium]
MSDARLMVIDGYSLLYRAFFATRYLSTSDGRPTNALFGFTTMLFNLLDKLEPTVVVVALDAPGKTFRHEGFSDYKGTRPETAEELKVQLRDARELVAALGIPTIECPGFEADDVVGTLVAQAEAAGIRSTIVTGDLDALQLVNDWTEVLTLKTGVTDTVTYDADAVAERYGFGPEFVPDFKALKGDKSDNIPGVPGIGDKSGAELIQQFGTIEAMLDRFDEIPEKYRKKLSGCEAQMRQSKWLATIRRDAPVTADFAPYHLEPDGFQAAVDMMERLEFRALVKRAPAVLARYQSGRDDPTTARAVVVDEALETTAFYAESIEDLTKWIGERTYALYRAPGVARTDLFDTEIPPAYIACGTEVAEIPAALAEQWFGLATDRAVIHDAKGWYGDGVASEPIQMDTMLAAFVLRSDRSHYPLRELIQGYLDVAAPATPAQLAAGLHLLEPVLADRLTKEGQSQVLMGIEQPLVPILAEMERYGIAADRAQFREFSAQLGVIIETTTARIHELAGRPFNIGSPKQLGEVLFDELKLPGAQKTKSGYATGVEVLADLAAEHEVVAEVLNWRELTKLKSTYADALERMVREDGRIHTTYHQTGAATGRLSSNDPNLQNIPIRTELGRSIRKAFRAAEGYRLASLDYSQIELRVLAHLLAEKSDDEALVRAFRAGDDVHTVTARDMFHTETVTKEQRRLAKMLNYAVLYGVTEYGLAQQLGAGFSVKEAKELIANYNERFPSIRAFTQEIVAEAKSKGFTTTLWGRRRYFPDIHASRLQERRYAERQAMNAPIQGTAADMLKLAMLECRNVLAGRASRMLLNVHDELVFEIAHGEESVIESLRTAMETALPLDVPVEVDAKIGDNWNEMTVIPRVTT